MGFQLSSNETLRMKASVHWTTFLLPGVWALFFTPSFVGSLVTNEIPGGGPSVMFFLMGYSPILYKWLQVKTTEYIVTDQRLYIAEGILRRVITEVPLNKINDCSVVQSLTQRLFKAGSLVVMTGNHKPTMLRNIDEPEAFKSHFVPNREIKAA